MYAWGWNPLENSAETVQLCLRMRSQKNTSFMFLHKTLQNTSWIPEGQRILTCQGDIGCLWRQHGSTRMSPGQEEQGRKSSTVRLHERSYKVYRGSLKFAGQRNRDNGLKKASETEVRHEELKGRGGNKVRRWHGYRLKSLCPLDYWPPSSGGFLLCILGDWASLPLYPPFPSPHQPAVSWLPCVLSRSAASLSLR